MRKPHNPYSVGSQISDMRRCNIIQHHCRKPNGVNAWFSNKRVRLMIGKKTLSRKLLEERMIEIKIHNGREQLETQIKIRTGKTSMTTFEILESFNNSMIRGFVNYYSLRIIKSCNVQIHTEYSMWPNTYTKATSTAHDNRTSGFCGKYKRMDFLQSDSSSKRQRKRERTLS